MAFFFFWIVGGWGEGDGGGDFGGVGGWVGGGGGGEGKSHGDQVEGNGRRLWSMWSGTLQVPGGF